MASCKMFDDADLVVVKETRKKFKFTDEPSN